MQDAKYCRNMWCHMCLYEMKIISDKSIQVTDNEKVPKIYTAQQMKKLLIVLLFKICC